MKVLYLTEWYPHRYDAMSGLFVRKHAAAAVRAGAEVCVLYLYKDTSIRQTETVCQQTDHIHEFYIYYPSSYLGALRRGWQTVKEKWGMPDVCQLNVITKNALLPLWLKWTRHIPFIIVEHWSGYLPQNGNYAAGCSAHRMLARLAARNACAVLPVSQALEDAMKRHGLRCRRWERMHNVVDDFFYTVTPQKHHTFTFLHVSCFDEDAKNVCGMLRAVRQAAEKHGNFLMVIVGTGADYAMARDCAEQLRFPEGMLVWTGEQTPEQVAQWFAEADAFVMFSNYENAPVVISEALATGTPTIATAVGGIPEMVNEACGILVPAGDEKALTEALIRMTDTSAQYDADAIRACGRAFAYDKVGGRLMQEYRQATGCVHNA